MISLTLKIEWFFYGDVKEVILPDAQKPCGKGFDMVCYVDTNLAEEKVTRSSQTSFVIFLNQVSIYRFSKRKYGVEVLNFGRDFIAMKQVCGYVRGSVTSLECLEFI